jgi:hypothetical protein
VNYQTTSGPRPHRYQSATAHRIPSPSSSLKKTQKDKRTKEAAVSLHRSEGRGFNCVPNTNTLIYTRGTEGSSASIAILNAAACDRQRVCVWEWGSIGKRWIQTNPGRGGHIPITFRNGLERETQHEVGRENRTSTAAMDKFIRIFI